MNIPSKVRIGSMNYNVLLTDKTILKGNQQCYGRIDLEQHKIEIDKTLQDIQGQEKTFLHELIHGIIHERNLDLQNTDEESLTDELATGLHQIVLDNPDIFKNT